MSAPLRLGTRASHLARTQSGHVADLIRNKVGLEVELVEISTEGDRSSAPLAQIGGTGVFVSALREALLDGRCDLAVHSLKDLPTTPEDGIVLAACPPREDPRDALVARDGLTLGELPPGSVIGTGSPRRAAQIAALGLGITTVPIRGNVETRVGKVASGEVDGVVLARAGLARIDRLDLITETLDPLQMLPAPGQGALAVECRAGDGDLIARLSEIDDPHTRGAVAAERAVLATLEAGCSAPVGALAEVVDDGSGELPEGVPGDGSDGTGGSAGFEVWVRAVALSPDGSVELRRSANGPFADAAGVGTRLAAGMLDEGAADLMDAPATSND